MIRKYKNKLERKINQHNIKEKLDILRKNIDNRKSIIKKEQELNEIDNIVTISIQ